MDDREIMQMALDALDKLLDKLNADICDNSGIWDEYCDGGNAMQALRARLAQPEPEPYCYTWDRWISGGNWEAQYGWEPYCGGKRPEHSTEAKPLYTAPPQREWQGLTDEEVRRIVQGNTDAWCDTPETDGYGVAEMVEAKLKEKNA